VLRQQSGQTEQIGGDGAPASRRFTVDLPPEVYETVLRLAAERGCTAQDVLADLLSHAIEAEVPAPREQPVEPMEPAAKRQRAHAAWRATAPPSSAGASPHEWAERLVEYLPLRFQKYIEELLFDDERILFFLYRPAFRIPGGVLRRAVRENEGVLVVTDRMVLLMQDAIPPGPMFVAWGYNAWMTAIERIRRAETTSTPHESKLVLECDASGGRENRELHFPPGAASDLSDVVDLLNRYASPSPLLPARRYDGRAPAWQPPESRRAFLAIAGRLPGEEEESEIEVAVAESETHRIELTETSLAIQRGGETQRIDVASVSSVAVWRAVTGCTLEIQVPQSREMALHRVDFQYPQAMPFMRVASRLRHYLGRPPHAA
jgi:hypothetical protein